MVYTIHLLGCTLHTDYIHIFTDGSTGTIDGFTGTVCLPNYKERVYVGGWGCVFLYKHYYKEISGAKLHATSDIVELLAIYNGILQCKRGLTPRVIIYSDSLYAVNTFTRWIKRYEVAGYVTSMGVEIKNLDLIRAIHELIKSEPRFTFKWIKGHSGIKHNERADTLAKEAKEKLKKSL